MTALDPRQPLLAPGRAASLCPGHSMAPAPGPACGPTSDCSLTRPAALIWFDPAGNVTDLNMPAARLLGHSPWHLMQCDWFDLRALPRTAPEALMEWDQIQRGRLCGHEGAVRRADGTEIWAALGYFVLTAPGGQVHRVMAQVLDLGCFASPMVA